MIQIIKEWTKTKDTNDFNYIDALATLKDNQSIENQSIEDYLHLDFSEQDVNIKLEAIRNIKQNDIHDLLEQINKYAYYLEMNKILKPENDINIKKLKKLNDILDDDFINFLDSYLYLDKTILSSKESLKIADYHQNVIKFYLQNDFKFALNNLNKFLKENKKAKNNIEVAEKELTNSIILKPQTKAYLKPIGERAILKCLYFDLLYHFKDINKSQAIDIIKEFFNETLEDKKPEHTLTAETIKYIKNNTNIYTFKENTSKKVIEEIGGIFNIKKYIEDNFTPLYTTYDK